MVTCSESWREVPCPQSGEWRAPWRPEPICAVHVWFDCMDIARGAGVSFDDVRVLVVGADLRCESCGEPAAGVANCMLAQPLSVAYCHRCLDEGIESWQVVWMTAWAIAWDGHELRRDRIAPWAIEIMERSLRHHGKSWEDVVEKCKAVPDPPIA